MDGSVTARLRLVLYRVSYSKKMRLSGHFFWEVRGSRSLDLEGCCDFDLRIKSIRPGISSSLLVQNIVAGEAIAAEKTHYRRCVDTESRNSTPIELFEVEFREITLYLGPFKSV